MKEQTERQARFTWIALTLWSIMATGFGAALSSRSTAAQGDYPPMTAAGQVDAINGGGKRLLAVDNHGVLEGNTVSVFNTAQGSANAAIGFAQGTAFPSWTAEIGEFVHLTGTTATAIKAGTGVLIELNVNTAATGTVSIFDLAAGSCTATPSTNTAAVLTMTATSVGAYPIHAHFVNGICVKASAAMDITAVYQ
jgi:hypothetical protein